MDKLGQQGNQDLEPWINMMVTSLLEPLAWLAQPSKRIYWLGLLISALLVYWFYRRENKTLSTLWSSKYWKHPSALLDYKLIFINHWLDIFLIGPALITMGTVSIGIATVLQLCFPISPVIWPTTLIMIVFTITAFLCEDLSRWWLHRKLHTWPLLWRFHQVHHSAEVLTPLTLYRMHPVEKLLFALRHSLSLGIVTGVFFWLFRSQLSGWQILGVDGIGFLLNLAGANLRHSHIPISWGKWERWIISPSQHQIHHSALPEHYDKNFGSFLSIWDRYSGSWYQGSAKIKLSYGLKEKPSPLFATSLMMALFLPFRRKKLSP